VPKLNLKKIFDLLWKLEAFHIKSFFYKCSFDFLFLSYSQVKLNMDSDFVKQILKTEILLYQMVSY